MKLPCNLGRYRLTERIAVGGTAEIYRAVLTATDGFAKTVVVKTLLPQWVGNDELSHLLIDEARILCHLNHQSIVQVYELGDDAGTPFLAMEYVDGIDCARLLTKSIRERRPPPIGLVLHIMSHVLSALKFAHERRDVEGKPIGVVHRDISPSNILLSVSGEVKITDFGIAKGSHRTQLTDAGQMRGKYAYMSPEQARGESIDHRSDLFSCGIVMFELLTASRLFKGRNDADLLEAVDDARIDFDPISSLPPQIRTIAMLSLAGDRRARYQSADEMLRDVKDAMLSLGELISETDLSSYLREEFPIEVEGIGRPGSDEPASVTRILTREGGMPSRGRLRAALSVWTLSAGRAAAILLIMTGLLMTHPARGSVGLDDSERSSVVVREEGDGVLDPPTVKGVIAIDTEPSGARGTITIGERRIDIETPYATSDIEMDGAVEGRIDLSLPGFKPYSEKFSITQSANAVVREINLKRISPARLFVGARPWGLASVSGYVKARETPVTALNVKPGTHLVTVKHPPSGRKIARRITIADGEVRKCLADFRGEARIRCR